MVTESARLMRVETLAAQYLITPEVDLERLFLNEIVTRRGQAPPVRGSTSEYWKGVRGRIVTGIVDNQNVVSVTVGNVAGKVLEHFSAIGIDLDAYEIPIAIFVALVTKAVLEELKVKNTRE